MNIWVPFPAAIDYSGLHDFTYSTFISLSNNFKIKRFNFGYGLSFAKNIWDLKYYDQFAPEPSNRQPVKKTHYSMGLYIPFNFQAGRYFYLGLSYRPSFYQFGANKKFTYEHVISFNLTWKLKFIK